LWEGRALIGGRVSKSHQNVLLTSAVIKREIGLELNPEEEKLDQAFRKGQNNG
jgi:DNA sulfur modification protein DndB